MKIFLPVSEWQSETEMEAGDSRQAVSGAGCSEEEKNQSRARNRGAAGRTLQDLSGKRKRVYRGEMRIKERSVARAPSISVRRAASAADFAHVVTIRNNKGTMARELLKAKRGEPYLRAGAPATCDVVSKMAVEFRVT